MEPSQLNQTFVPKNILKKTNVALQDGTLNTNLFQATGGNPYIEFDPVEIKFNGYELGKTHTAVVKVINKSPIPQRVHVLPPTKPGFAIKVNKKGPIAAGMSENIQVTFISDVYQYQEEAIKINSETGNFVIPIYAYPSIPKINEIFPRIIDFGSLPVNQSNSFIYPINNIVSLDFGYEFKYIEESPAFIITPIKGIASANSVENIQITFIPSEKRTYVAEVLFMLKQFDFQPIRIKIMGTGQEKKEGLRSTRRIQSSKLNPLKTDQKKNEGVAVSAAGVDAQNVKTLDLTSNKKSFIRSRTSYPKLLKKSNALNYGTNMSQIEKLESNIKNETEREYNSQFGKIQELDKEKQIKFIQYLGNSAMTEDELEFERKLAENMKNSRHENLKQFCTNRHEHDHKNDGEVDFTRFVSRNVSWDINKNNDLKIRKEKLQTFVKAGSRLISKYRLLKRLGKIKEFLSGCTSKEEVKKKVEEDFAKSRDNSEQGNKKIRGKLDFSLNMLEAASFQLQFKDDTESFRKAFETEGSTKFDDDKPVQEIKPHETEMLGHGNLLFPPDFIYQTKLIPASRRSAEQQYPLKTACLPNYIPPIPSSVYSLPQKVPTHQFIYNNFQLMRYKTLNAIDEKDPEYVIDATVEDIEDQFEGWSRGDLDVLKAKFQRNLGTEFSGVSTYNYPVWGDLGFLGQIGKHLPKEIGNLNIPKDDILEEGDSDDEKVGHFEIEKAEALLAKVEQTNAKAKERREKGQVISYERNLMDSVNRNLESVKYKNISQGIDKISEYNKWCEKRQNRILI